MELDKSLDYYSTGDEADIGEKFVTKATIDLVKEKIIGKRILNLGLGNGKTSLIFDNLVSSQLVVEGSSEILKKFSFPSKKTNFVHSYFEDFKTDIKFDVVLANHVLEHVDNPENLMCSKFHEWLNDDGIVFITVPNAKSIHRLIGKQMGLLESEYDLNDSDFQAGHQRVYDATTLRAQIEKAGLEILEMGGYNVKVVSLAQMKDWSQELLDSIFEVSKQMPPEICANIWVTVRKK